MLDQIARNQTLAGARIVTPTGVIDGALDLEDGRVAGVRPGVSPAGADDLAGDFLIPGIVDVHTDHVEAHVSPRAGVQWDFLNALMAHDAVVIAGGTTTVLDSLCVGASMKRPERRDLLVRWWPRWSGAEPGACFARIICCICAARFAIPTRWR
jgi:alpha-D-ribose 1-methylphosphonate 5-triphosphate diphosphatase